MAKTAVRERKRSVRPVQVQTHPRPSDPLNQRSKSEQAMEYLNKFHPGWDVYLKSKDN